MSPIQTDWLEPLPMKIQKHLMQETTSRMTLPRLRFKPKRCGICGRFLKKVVSPVTGWRCTRLVYHPEHQAYDHE